MKTSFHGKLMDACLTLATVSAVFSFASVSRADDNKYQQVNLVSDLPNVAALQDTNLVNAWGISFGPATPFWVSDNGTGLSTLYQVTNNAAGAPQVSKVALEVTIPGDGTPTGQAFNGSAAFNGDVFLFVSEDGTVSGWRPALGTAAETLVPGSSNTVYKGMTLVTTSNNGPVLLASNFKQGTVDMYGTNAALLGQFSDVNTPGGYAPFGIQAIDGMVFVTFAKQDKFKHDDVAGRGHGLIDVFDPNTGAFHRFATGTDAVNKHSHNMGIDHPIDEINSPWGVALAPDSFGKAGGNLLVGNFGSGTIMTFDARGRFRGELEALHGRSVTIDGLWALTFGNGTKSGVTNVLYFSAGPIHESHGLFGSLQPAENNHKHHGGHDDRGGDRDQDND
ncbi:MAG TPA: TIGR03118 family protein [Verrucomicrobiae bacterium]|jgi:uncharacterized protein (TIGR03118 family)|nr:TIGR03118 family protein [Verrucomicrobiae bacterium]